MADRASVSHITDDTAHDDAKCDRKPGHPGLCMKRCTATPGCTERVGHRGRCTEGTFNMIAWASDDGVSTGSTAVAGAPVSPVQTTDHADLSVSGVTDEMLESAALAVGGFLLAVDEDQVEGDGRTICREGARRVLSAALAGCTVAAAPELIELPKFQGCTDSNPDLCACGEAALMCAACDEEIEDSSRAYTVREKCKPWLADDDRDQEWQDVWWHFSCDERATGSQVGDQQHG